MLRFARLAEGLEGMLQACLLPPASACEIPSCWARRDDGCAVSLTDGTAHALRELVHKAGPWVDAVGSQGLRVQCSGPDWHGLLTWF